MRSRGQQHTPAATRNPSPRIAGGTLGGILSRPGMSSGRFAPQGDTIYLWTLVALELLGIVWLRKAFKRYHGG